MKLIIAEKPSVGNAIAKVLGVKKREDGYIEGNGYIVSWCVGHLVSLAYTEQYDEKYAKWNLTDLPIIPNDWEYIAQDGKEKQLKLLCKLLDRVDVNEVINACDSGREGELIFKLVYNYSGSTVPIKRLWISSMEDQAILDGFDNLKSNKDYENLYQSAVCRQQADWLVGINATRLFSVLYGQNLNVGRVMSPTLSMIVQRTQDIEIFKPTPFYKIKVEIEDLIFITERFENEETAKKILGECDGDKLVIKDITKKEKIENAPKLFDLTTLQRICNRELGYTANETLGYVQKLYEKKLCTYPRTDSRFVTEDMHDTLKEVLGLAYEFQGIDDTIVCNAHKVINNDKVSDHHAIIPTKNINSYDFSQLEKGELEVLRKIIEQLICSLNNEYQYLDVVITAKCNETDFTIKQKFPTDLGFKKYIQNKKDDKDVKVIDISNLNVEDVFDNITPTIEVGETTPPKNYTEDTLLSAMESAGKGDDIDKKFIGIGTPATRSSIIDKLEKISFIKRTENKGKKAKHLIPTKKGISLVTVLPEKIKSATTTSYWEEQLFNIENGSLTSAEFMNEINDMITDLVKNYEIVAESEKLFESKFEKIGICPRCGKDIIDKNKAFSCVSNDCGFILWKENKLFQSIKQTLSKKLVKAILKDGKAPLSNCYSQKTGKTFNCIISLNDDGKYVNFKMDFDNTKKKK